MKFLNINYIYCFPFFSCIELRKREIMNFISSKYLKYFKSYVQFNSLKNVHFRPFLPIETNGKNHGKCPTRENKKWVINTSVTSYVFNIFTSNFLCILYYKFSLKFYQILRLTLNKIWNISNQFPKSPKFGKVPKILQMG